MQKNDGLKYLVNLCSMYTRATATKQMNFDQIYEHALKNLPADFDIVGLQQKYPNDNSNPQSLKNTVYKKVKGMK